MREKNKRNARDDDHSLAGACGVNGQPVQPEETVEADDAPVEATAEDALDSAATATNAPAVGVEIENGSTSSLVTGPAVVATDAKATTTAAAGATPSTTAAPPASRRSRRSPKI